MPTGVGFQNTPNDSSIAALTGTAFSADFELSADELQAFLHPPPDSHEQPFNVAVQHSSSHSTTTNDVSMCSLPVSHEDVSAL